MYSSNGYSTRDGIINFGILNGKCTFEKLFLAGDATSSKVSADNFSLEMKYGDQNDGYTISLGKLNADIEYSEQEQSVGSSLKLDLGYEEV